MQATSKSEFWTKHIAAQGTSRQSQRGYCEDHGLSLSTFHFWKRRLSNRPLPSQSSKEKISVGKGQQTHSRRNEKFIPIRLSPQMQTQKFQVPLFEFSLSENMELSFSFKSGSPRGAYASCAIYSLIQTAKANGLDAYSYLRYLFEKLATITDEKEIVELAPHKIEMV